MESPLRPTPYPTCVNINYIAVNGDQGNVDELIVTEQELKITTDDVAALWGTEGCDNCTDNDASYTQQEVEQDEEKDEEEEPWKRSKVQQQQMENHLLELSSETRSLSLEIILGVDTKMKND